MNKKPCIFNNFVLENFPYIEEDFDSLTNYQLFSKIVGYVQDIKKIVDEHSKFIGDFEEQYQTLLNEFNELKADYEEFKVQIENEIDSKFAQVKTELTLMIESEISVLRYQMNQIYNELNKKIDDVIAGDINVYDPTTGEYSPIQVVINNLFDMNRNEAISASEFDSLELTATEFDEKELTAYNFDVYSKTLLTE
jgi:vacuolar-type H+-ATPase subunit I/STV1